MRILGIDPGFAITGYSIIDYIGNKFKLIDNGAILTKAGVSFPQRLTKIYDDLNLIIDKYDGGPVGIETIAAALSEDVRTIEDVCEPYLLQAGLFQRTPRGRKVSPEGYRHLGIKIQSMQTNLFD